MSNTIAANSLVPFSFSRSQSSPNLASPTRPALQRTQSAPALVNTAPSSAPASAQSGWYGKAADKATTDLRTNATGYTGAALGGLSLATGIATLPGKYREFIKAIQNGDIPTAVQQGAITARGTLATAKSALDLGALIDETVKFRKVAQLAQKGIGAEGKVAKAIAEKAAANVFSGKALRNVDTLAEIAKSKGFGSWLNVTGKMAVADTLKKFGLTGAAQSIEKGVAQAGRKVAAEGGEALLKGLAHGDDVVKAALKAGKVADVALDAGKAAATAAKGAGAAVKGAGTLAKLAGRFAPGVNIALAGLDVATAVATWANPKASIAAKVTSGISALGSIAAATNIPIVSQVGAAVSVAATVTGAVIDNFGAIKEGVKKVGNTIAEGAKKVGEGIAEGAKKVGEGIANAAKKIFSGW
jgi:hypothetical protein